MTAQPWRARFAAVPVLVTVLTTAACSDGTGATASSEPSTTSAGTPTASEQGSTPGGSTPSVVQTPAPSPSATGSVPSISPAAIGPVQGIDVSAYQPTVDWARWRDEGVAFTYVKASEGTTWTNTYFSAQWKGARAVGMYTGAYHYALPGSSSGAAQAQHFVDSGGGWTADGRTLPGALDLEQDPRNSADPCHGKTPAQMVSWIRDFTSTYKRLTGREAVIYVKAGWWAQCTAGNSSFSANPLWLYDHRAPMGPVPAGWKRPTIWQYAVKTVDRNVFLAGGDELARWAADS